MIRFPFNKTIVHSVSFKNPDGSPRDPTTVIFRIRDPKNVEVVYETGTGQAPTNPQPGTYKVTYKATEWGVWEWEATGESVDYEAQLGRREYFIEKPISAT